MTNRRIAPSTAASRAFIAILTVLGIGYAAFTDAGQSRRTHPRKRAARVARKAPAPAKLPCGDYLAFQVLLDRQGFSTGEIDDAPGPNVAHALAAFRSARGLPLSDTPDCEAWRALGGDSEQPALTTYKVTEDDTKGPFAEDIPSDLMQQSKLPALDYRSTLEMLGERFHVAPALLKKLNPRAQFMAGEEIRVPAVEPFNASMAPPRSPGADAKVIVTRDDSALRVTKGDGTLVFFAPVTTGSTHDPLPTGDYAVTSVNWRPVFHYNPDLFWDANPRDEKAAIKPGPNNPVGVVWIALSLEHYGIHGTPEPGHIGHTESHGCVRLTNWDAARVASLVSKETPVQFR